VGLQSGNQPTVCQYRRENTAGQITQRFDRAVHLRADLLEKSSSATGGRFEHLAREARVDGDGHQVLLRAIMDVALDAAPLRILRGDDALARGAQLFGLHRELIQPCMELECQAKVRQSGTGLCSKICQQLRFRGAQQLSARLCDCNLPHRNAMVKH